jgi:hypothetical protein
MVHRGGNLALAECLILIIGLAEHVIESTIVNTLST